MCGVAAPVPETVNGLHSEFRVCFYMKYFELSRLGVWGVAILLLGAFAIARTPEGGYHLLKKYELGAAPGGKEYWDYITFDASTRRLYISYNSEVKVVDADSGAILGSIADLKRVHGIALVSDLGRGFISDGGADEAVVFDLQTLKVTGHIKTGGNPDCILYEPASKHVFTMNGKSSDATVIDPAMDMDVQHRRLFIGGRNKVLAIMDADSGKVLQTFPIGDGVDTNIYEPETGLLFTATREGTLLVVHEDTPDKFSVVETVKTEFGARNMALDPKSHQLFIDTADFAPAAAPTAEQPKPQPIPVSGTFRLLVYGR